MVIFLYGADTYRSRQSLSKMMEKFRQERDPQGLNLVRLDAAKDHGRILQEVMAVPFLAEKRMVVIESLLETSYDDVQQALLTRVEDQTIPSESIVIVYERKGKPKAKKARMLFDRLLKEPYVQHFDLLTGAARIGWILAEIKERGGDIEREAASRISTGIGGDMWRCSHVIDQLISYTNGRQISQQDVALFLDEAIDDNIFSLVDALTQRQSNKIFTMIQEQYRRGYDPGYIFAMIVRQFRIFLELRDMYDRGESVQSDSVATTLGIHPFVVKKSLPFVKRHDMRVLRNIYEALLAMDWDTKVGRLPQETALDMFIFHHTEGSV